MWPQSRTLVLFAHFDPQDVIDPYVVYYLEALHRLGATIIFVSTSSLTLDSVTPIQGLCAGIYTRQNRTLGDGSWHTAWRIMSDRGWSLDQFDRIVLANDSVYGPLFPLEEMWETFHDADMYGAIESTLKAPHLQSFFLVWDLNSRTRRFLNDFWNGFQYIDNKNMIIDKYEVGLSKRARAAGLRIKPFLSIEETKAVCAHPSLDGWYDKINAMLSGQVNDTIVYWDVLVEHARFPWLKTRVLRNAPGFQGPWHGPTTWQDSMAYLQRFIEQHTQYPFELIGSNVERLGLATCHEPGLQCEEYHKWYYNTLVWTRTTWMGVECQKSVSDMWNYQEILFELKPSLVIEFGTAVGGSALFFADIMRRIGEPFKVLSVDVTHGRLDPAARRDPDILFVESPSTVPAIAQRIQHLKSKFPGKIFAILDSNHSMNHVLAEMKLLRPLLSAGDYLIVEDSMLNGHPVDPGWGPGPYEAIEAYEHEFPNDYTHDVAREKKFGWTQAPNGYLIRT